MEPSDVKPKDKFHYACGNEPRLGDFVRPVQRSWEVAGMSVDGSDLCLQGISDPCVISGGGTSNFTLLSRRAEPTVEEPEIVAKARKATEWLSDLPPLKGIEAKLLERVQGLELNHRARARELHQRIDQRIDRLVENLQKTYDMLQKKDEELERMILANGDSTDRSRTTEK